MQPVRREDVLDYVTWSEKRATLAPAILDAKRKRRVHVGDALTLLFENRDTVRYQIQEMMRVECIVKEADIRREIETYNELLGVGGEIGATLLIEIEDPVLRAKRLAEWLDLPEHVYLELEDGRRIFATSDTRQRDAERLSSVQFLKFATGGAVPVAAGADLPSAHLNVAVRLTEEQRAALREDLAS